MPRKPKPEKRTITVVVNGTPVAVTLHPPGGARKSWYAYWNGLVSSRSTGQPTFEQAVKVVEDMLRHGGERRGLHAALLSDEEFEAIQRAHFARKTDPAAQARSAKTLEECLDAIAAFKAITRLDRVASATPDDCARFQTEALTRPVTWRKEPRTAGLAAGDPQATGPSSRKRRPSKTQRRRALAGVSHPAAERISPNTVLKWSRMLQAAFQRANLNAGKKCVRGVVLEDKLLTANPWTQFTWVEGTASPIRQFDARELVGILDFLESGWQGVPVAAQAVKVLLWSCCRKLEVAGLTWAAGRVFTNDRQVFCASECSLTAEGSVAVQGRPAVIAEAHFEVVGKWGVERWFRIPGPLYRELLAHRTDSPFVFAAYTEQLRRLHADNPGCLKKVRDEFTPQNFGRWLYERIKDWAATHARGGAYLHVFRKTGLQFAHDGEEEEVSRKVADDAGVSEKVLLGHYVKPKLWRQSNRTFRRLLASLPTEVATRYGHVEDDRTRLERQLDAAKEAGNWALVAELAAAIGRMDRTSRSEAS
jgi:hypothetical protein